MTIKNLIAMPVLRRTVLLWLIIMAMLWTIFAAALATHPEAWTNVPPVVPEKGWNVFWFICLNNFLILILISLGNIFARFGNIAPGLIILVLQAVTIGWTAGTNGFVEPFQSVAAANVAFLRIALWEITAYILFCSVSIPKALLVSDKFPPKRWVKSSSLKELSFTSLETGIVGLALLALISAAAIEAFLPI